MAVQTITYQDKQYLDENAGIAAVNKVRDVDMNEIKNVVNNNASETTQNTTGISDIIAGEVFSKSEVLTNRVWIDNKPIYRKVLEINPTDQSSGVSHNISNLGTLVEIEGLFKRNGSNIYNLLPCNYTNWEAYIYDFNPTGFTLKFSNNQWNAGIEWCYVTLYYTKTTD